MKIKMKVDSDLICDQAFNGLEALDAVRKDFEENQKKGGNFTSYKLILMDCQMPFMDGYEATRQIRQFIKKAGAKQPIISAITGHTESSYVETAFKSGMNQVLSKPINIELFKWLLKKTGFLKK